MKSLLCILALLLAGPTVWAHPGVGIVLDRRGNVCFTDLKQVWKIAPDGTKSVAVPNVHTHELCLDAEDNLYGEHLWYEGDATKKWGHRVWRLKRDGTLSDVMPAREGFLKDDSFVRDRAGNRYWADRGERTVIKKRAPDGKISTHATAAFRDVLWMTATPDGTLFLIDSGDLRRVAPDGKVTTVAAKLSGHTPPPAAVSQRHYHMGLWTDGDGSVYVAVAEESLVLKVRADGETSVVARSTGTWRPSGGVFDRDGNLWLLEHSTTLAKGFEARARRIASGTAASRKVSQNNLKQLILALINYADSDEGRLPPHAIFDKDGKPLLSWRVLILPRLGQDALYKEFHLDEPWDSNHNKKLLAKMPRVFSPGPMAPGAFVTPYQVFVGEVAGFDGWRPQRYPRSFTDGTANTLSVVEAANPVPWTKPEDLTYDASKPLPDLGGLFLNGFNAALFDGSVRVVSHNLSERTLRSAITRNGGEILLWADWQP